MDLRLPRSLTACSSGWPSVSPAQSPSRCSQRRSPVPTSSASRPVPARGGRADRPRRRRHASRPARHPGAAAGRAGRRRYSPRWPSTCSRGGAGSTGFRLVLIGIGVNAMLIAVARLDADVGAGHQRRVAGAGLAQRVAQRTPTGQVWPVAVAVVVVGGCRRRSRRSRWARCASATTTPCRSGCDCRRSRPAPAARRRPRRAIATAAAGPIGFVALAAPQIALRLLRPRARRSSRRRCSARVLVVGSDVSPARSCRSSCPSASSPRRSVVRSCCIFWSATIERSCGMTVSTVSRLIADDLASATATGSSSTTSTSRSRPG